MVRVQSDIQTILSLYEKNTNSQIYGSGDQIEIESDFQRGDEETGVWSRSQQQHFIDSLRKNYPTGILVFVKDHFTATSYQNPWKVLDGGNRLRAIRDYIDNKFTDTQGVKYEDLEHQDIAKFNTLQIPCQWMTIEREDPTNTIAEMFTRLNTKSTPLSQGELFKAHGWKKDCWEIEMAKKLIADIWSSNYNSDQFRIETIRNKWDQVLGTLRESKRCDSLAMIIGFIISSHTEKFAHFDKRYDNLHGLLYEPEQQPSDTQKTKIFNKLELFLSIMEEIYTKEIFGTVNKGIPSRSKIAIIWKRICENTMTNDFRRKMIDFFQVLPERQDIRDEYNSILFSKGNSETSDTKINTALDFIENTME
jgi:hypothetical protein